MTRKNLLSCIFLCSITTLTQNTTLNLINNIMNLTKSIRELAADINTAPGNYDSNDDVSEECLSVEAEFEAAGVLRREGEGASDG